jgi:hypothetical protein
VLWIYPRRQLDGPPASAQTANPEAVALALQQLAFSQRITLERTRLEDSSIVLTATPGLLFVGVLRQLVTERRAGVPAALAEQLAFLAAAWASFVDPDNRFTLILSPTPPAGLPGSPPDTHEP